MSKLLTRPPSSLPRDPTPTSSTPTPTPPPTKTSLGFLLSPNGTSHSSSTTTAAPTTPPISVNPPSNRSPLSASAKPSPAAGAKPSPPSLVMAASPTASTKRPRSNLDLLPPAALTQIAYHLVVDNTGNGGHPSALIPLLLTCRATYNAISFDNNPKLYNSLFRATFDYAALDRRYEWMVQHLSDVAGRGRKIFDLFSDPRSWAVDYKTRWGQSWRMRQVVKHHSIHVPGVCDRDQLTADLWNVWFMLTENDGKNIHFLAEECSFQPWIVVYYKDEMLKESLVPGYPPETGTKALSIWCALLSGTDLSAEQTPAEVDEKIFIMRPYVFACAKYDITYAPWHHRRLPLCEPNCKEHEPDVTMRSKAMPYKRFGYTWMRAPPHFVLGCYLVFLRLLERQPGRMGLKPGSSTFSLSPADAMRPGLFSTTRIMPSIYHDREWQRDTMCQDPHTSPGLPPLTFRGELQGFWRGKFLFYDFDMYRQILAGNMRGVYTGTFAEQAAEMEFKETVIKVRKEEVGGDGPMLCAGFQDEAEEGSEEEQSRIQAGYGHEVCKDENEPDEEGWTKEILITGRCRTSWGWAQVRGRVRAWDGLVMLAIAYSRHVMGRWLWRGYLHTGGHLIGRWRDTFTVENLRGYEGAFGMVRAGDIFYPSHFPKRMEDSLGVDHSGVPGHAPGPVPAFPSQQLLSRPVTVAHQSRQAHSISTPPTPLSAISGGRSPSVLTPRQHQVSPPPNSSHFHPVGRYYPSSSERESRVSPEHVALVKRESQGPKSMEAWRPTAHPENERAIKRQRMENETSLSSASSAVASKYLGPPPLSSPSKSSSWPSKDMERSSSRNPGSTFPTDLLNPREDEYEGRRGSGVGLNDSKIVERFRRTEGNDEPVDKFGGQRRVSVVSPAMNGRDVPFTTLPMSREASPIYWQSNSNSKISGVPGHSMRGNFDTSTKSLPPLEHLHPHPHPHSQPLRRYSGQTEPDRSMLDDSEHTGAVKFSVVPESNLRDYGRARTGSEGMA
ncbi:hypothetical protein BCR39DRAFT_170415 [Naematelia encephala]|uniref:F-box domain-containing protein n=1 Tax=Naematelia encephala TaxID=71784 RepID=A0A1Y2B4Q3_9TREE|nr:hypothetical protein BCR39DRAFT_170415 [Naematelia encephala]